MLRSFHKRSFFVGSVICAASLCALPVLAATHPATDIAVKNWSFTPATVEAHVGEPTVLRFTSSEGVHGVESADVGLAKETIAPGKVSEVTFTPKKEGTYSVHCAVVCGEGHDKMVLTVKVVK
ncbi:MAG: cupredoxin domain-containing protein [Candidatus Eremiobacteraeota bacterium]|nr:cupredoxin domain-containing protein [Candidatus Eremiobacteraeota bacterium]